MKSFQKITTIHTVVTERIEDALITAVRSEGFFLNKEAKDESDPELQFKSKTKAGAESETENRLRASPECEAEPEEKAESAPEPEAEIRVGSEEETALEPEAEIRVGSEEETALEPEAEPIIMSECEPDAGSEEEGAPESGTESMIMSECEPDDKPEFESAPDPDEDIFESDFLEGAPEWTVRKIQRREIAELARCEWRLANNHFLTHGYYNYHHLALLENDEQLLLGVPGIYHRREAAAAETFGFPRFIALDELAVDLSPEERNEDEKFGYWCRSVRRPVRREQTKSRG